MAYSGSTCAGLMSPDMTAKSLMSCSVRVRSSVAVSPISISSNVRFSMYSKSNLRLRRELRTRRDLRRSRHGLSLAQHRDGLRAGRGLSEDDRGGNLNKEDLQYRHARKNHRVADVGPVNRRELVRVCEDRRIPCCT